MAIAQRIPGIDVEEFLRRQVKAVEKYSSIGKLDNISKENLKALDKLKKAGKNLTVLTSRTFPEIKHFLHKNHPLASRVEEIYHAGKSKYHKPDPRVFDQVLIDFKTRPEEAVYIGDAVVDAIASKSAGLSFVAVLESGLFSKKDFKDFRVDFFVNKFYDIVPFILAD